MADGNEWNPEEYDDGHGFVYEYGQDVLDVLDPSPSDRVLDVGCGTGHLTVSIADSGADVVGIDASSEMVAEARDAYADPRFECADAREYDPDGSFDAVFSNAAFHWIPGPDHDAVLSMVADALTDGGRFVAELGGRGNVQRIAGALEAELADRGVEVSHPWYFPSIGEYAPRLEAHGFEVTAAWLFDRPTELDGGADGLRNWVRMFGDEFFGEVSDTERERVLDGVEDRLRDDLFDAERATWTADYRRLRFTATR